MAFVFIFNLIVGTGALTLPSAFDKTGYVIGIFLVLLLCLFSFMTSTWIIEVISCTNALVKWKKLGILKRERAAGNRDASSLDGELDDDEEQNLLLNNSDYDNEVTPLCIQKNEFYSLKDKFELGEMAQMFFTQTGSMLFYLCIAIYLYGDLSIYSAAVSNTLRDVMCDKNITISDNATAESVELCWSTGIFTRFDVYRINLIGFTMILSPFVFFNVTKTKYLQFCTIIFRWLAFAVMISIAIHRLFNQNFAPDAGHNDSRPNPPKANFMEIPYLLGALIYSFMCQHSLPSLIKPIKDKLNIHKLISIDFMLILVLYLVLALTGIFAFNDIKDLYTLNFIPSPDQQSGFLKVIEYFLALFPVFTLTTSFPIIGITLRNNLQTLFLDKSQMENYNFFIRRFAFPLMTIIPTFIITFNTENVLSLVSFTGNYGGAGIQYIIPIALVFYARRSCTRILGTGIVNEYRSVFESNKWLWLILVWTGLSLIMVTINIFK